MKVQYIFDLFQIILNIQNTVKTTTPRRQRSFFQKKISISNLEHKNFGLSLAYASLLQ